MPPRGERGVRRTPRRGPAAAQRSRSSRRPPGWKPLSPLLPAQEESIVQPSPPVVPAASPPRCRAPPANHLCGRDLPLPRGEPRHDSVTRQPAPPTGRSRNAARWHRRGATAWLEKPWPGGSPARPPRCQHRYRLHPRHRHLGPKRHTRPPHSRPCELPSPQLRHYRAPHSPAPASTPTRASRFGVQASPAGTITTRRLGSSPSEIVATPSSSAIVSWVSLRSAPFIGSNARATPLSRTS